MTELDEPVEPVEPFDALLASLGYELEGAVLRAGLRGIGVARGAAGRVLVTVVGPGVDREALQERPGWDLPLASADEVATDSGPRTVVVESLPVGVPSTWLDGGTGEGADPHPGTPLFAIAFAELVAAAHEAGQTVGLMQPELVLVEPSSRTLAGTAQRPLRADAGAQPIDGAPRFFGAAFLTPGEARGELPATADDVFRLAAFAWRWRHGTDPFAGPLPDRLVQTLAGTPLERHERAVVPDELDRLLVRAFDPGLHRRPSAVEVVAALAATGDRWFVAGARSTVG